MLIMSYIIFLIILPVICIFYRFRKRISTGFAFAGIFSSFTLGIIFVGTFQEKPASRIVKFLNENRLNEAKKELQYILQRNPEDVRKIDTRQIESPLIFEKIKSEVREDYLKIVQSIINRDEGIYK